jgi:hypothetical protein
MNITNNYKLLKLVTGEDIICTTDKDFEIIKTSNSIQIIDPVIVKSIRYSRGNSIVESYVLQPWLRFAMESVYTIFTNSIVSVVDLDKKIIDLYTEFIKNEKNTELSDKNEQSMESKVKEFLENLNSIAENDHAEEEFRYKPKVTLH